MVYEKAKVGEVASIRGGKRLPVGKDFTTSVTAHPYIRARDIGGGRVKIHDPVFIDEGTAQKLARYTVRNGDVCLTIVGANVGAMGVVPPHLDGANLTENAVKIVSNGRADQAFLKYALLSEDAIAQMKVLAGGAAQPKLGIYKVETIEFPFPPLPIQKRIAGILSAYDELIENSQRRINILESMARALYGEWFGHFRFPGSENLARVSSPLGEIPQGWVVKRIGETFQTILGGTPSRARAEYWCNGTVPWINSGKVNDLRITEPSELITELALRKSAAKLMPKGTTVLAITGATLGQVSHLEIETAANQSVVGITDPSGRMSEWIYLTICARIEGIIKHASGGAQQHINKEVVNDVLIALPEARLAAKFKSIVEPIFREIAALLFQVQNLRRTRDLLLPRLLSGQIEVEAA